MVGELRHLITITLDVATGGVGDRGQGEYTTTTLGQMWAKIEPLTGRKMEIARQLVATATHTITCRPLDGVIPACKVVFGDRTFNVGSVVNKLERGILLELLCSEEL